MELLRDEDTLNIFRIIISEVSRFPELKDKIYTLGRNPFRAKLIAFLQEKVAAGQLPNSSFSTAAENYIGLLSYWFIFARIFNPMARISDELAESIMSEARATLIARLKSL